MANSKFHLQTRHPERNGGRWCHLQSSETSHINGQTKNDNLQINDLRRARNDWVQNYPQRYGTSETEFRITNGYDRHSNDVVVAPGHF